MAKQLEKGFAVAGQESSDSLFEYFRTDSVRGDSGHIASQNGFTNGTATSGKYLPFLNNIDQTKAWIHDSIAIITVPTREITTKFYGSRPKYSYYNGCSTGGAQGFALAQFHPHLFDGIYAGSPGNWYSHLMIYFIWNHVHSKVSQPAFKQWKFSHTEAD